jgi:DNA repair protein RadA/Sms
MMASRLSTLPCMMTTKSPSMVTVSPDVENGNSTLSAVEAAPSVGNASFDVVILDAVKCVEDVCAADAANCVPTQLGALAEANRLKPAFATLVEGKTTTVSVTNWTAFASAKLALAVGADVSIEAALTPSQVAMVLTVLCVVLFAVPVEDVDFVTFHPLGKSDILSRSWLASTAPADDVDPEAPALMAGTATPAAASRAAVDRVNTTARTGRMGRNRLRLDVSSPGTSDLLASVKADRCCRGQRVYERTARDGGPLQRCPDGGCSNRFLTCAAMTRPTSVHRCRMCDATAPRWAGRCPDCGEWNSLEPVARPAAPAANAVDVQPLAHVAMDGATAVPTGLSEVDRVLAGGLVPGSVTLLYGEPGVGKSTLTLQVLRTVAAEGRCSLLVSAEESAQQVRARAARLGPVPEHLLVVVTGDIDAACAAVESTRPAVAVVDSVQTVSDRGATGPSGSPAQVRACAERLSRTARSSGAAIVLVGHVTKDGDPAGPRTLEHLVDSVLAFEGDRHHTLRMLRAVKHRYGATGEIGLFEMADDGVRDVADPGPLLLGDRRADVPGSAVTAVVQGRRSLLVEVQALVCAGLGGSRRTAVGLDGLRLAAVAAVLEAHQGFGLSGLEVYASAAGGVRAAEPATDLALALALASAATGVPVPADLVAFGEVGLGGEVRQAAGAVQRLTEAARLGFHRAVVPLATPDPPPGLVLARVATVGEALAVAGIGATAVPRRSERPAPV